MLIVGFPHSLVRGVFSERSPIMPRTRFPMLSVLALGAILMTSADRAAWAQASRRNRAPADQPAAVPAAPAPAAPAAPAPPLEPLRTAGQRPIDIRDIRLDLRVDMDKKTVDAEATLRFRALRSSKTIRLDAGDFKITKVTLAAAGAEPTTPRFSHDSGKLAVELDSAWPVGQEGTLRVEYTIHEPKEGLRFTTVSPANPDQPLAMWSQGEPTSNHHWFPCLDIPNQRQSTEIVATVPEGFEAVSNGKLVDRKENHDGKTVTFHWRQEQPHPAYLVTLAVSQFEVVREEWEGIPVLYYVPKGRRDDVARTFGRTREMLTFFSQRFGIRYPWDKYAQVCVSEFGGGMENTSATTLGIGALKDERSLLDNDSDGLISHELAHQWWGDMVTCRDWAHLWLNEGFASYAEALWDEHRHGADECAYNMYRKSATAMEGGKSRPIVDRRYPSAGTMFDGRAYPKGAWVLHMLRKRLGDDAFFRGMARYGSERRMQSAETADFRRALEAESGQDLERFFYDWTERAGNPIVEIATDYLPESQQARVVIKQTQTGEPFQFPLTLALTCAGAAAPTVVHQDVTDKETTVQVPVPGRLTRIDVDPEQSLLAEIKETKGRELWRAQLLEAPDVPARIRAARHFGESKTDDDRKLLGESLAAEKFWGVQTEIAAALGKSGGAPSREALVQGLRDSKARVRRSCVDGLGSLSPDPAIAQAIRDMLQKGDPSYAVEGAALAAYAKQGQKDAVAVLLPWLDKPSNQDNLRGAALTALGDTQDPAALAPLLSWAQPGKPTGARSGALRGLVQVMQKAKATPDQRAQIQKVISSALEGKEQGARFAIFMRLPELGAQASPFLPTLDKISRDDPNERLRELAKRTATQIREKTSGSTASAEESRLREEVQQLRRQQELLRQRLEKLEKVAGKG
jgi:aminopeptidase N